MIVKHVIFEILLLLIAYFLIGGYLLRKLAGRLRAQRMTLKDYEHHLRRVARVDADILDGGTLETIRGLADRAKALRTTRAASDDLSEEIGGLDEHCEHALAYRQHHGAWARETLEVAVVALSLAFGFRALVLQPFKIPTGSMQPTLFGIHFVSDPEREKPSLPKCVFDYLHYSRRYVDVTIERSGRYQGMRKATSVPLFPATEVIIGGVTYRLPGNRDAVFKQVDAIYDYERAKARYAQALRAGVPARKPAPPYYEAGDVLARGYLVAGDHVFVNRFWLNFTDVERGDVTVFLTDGITLPNGNALRGRYYIKRLVGLPGDTLEIRDNRLYVKPRGEDEFELMDAAYADAFARIYSGQGGYHGYIRDMQNPDSAYLRGPYTVPDGRYFMLGDNSLHSMDSRFWGTVPRANIVGRADLLWWPLSRRWGVIDATEPVDEPTVLPDDGSGRLE